MDVRYLNGSNEPEEYFEAVPIGTTVLEDNNITVVSKLTGPTIKVIIVDTRESEAEDPWYCFMELPPDLYLAFFQIVSDGLSLAQAINTALPWFLEGIIFQETTKNTGIKYTIPREEAVDLFGEDWVQYLRDQ